MSGGQVSHLQRSLRAPFPRRVPHPCVFCKGGQRCCVRYLILLWTRDQSHSRRHFPRFQSSPAKQPIAQICAIQLAPSTVNKRYGDFSPICNQKRRVNGGSQFGLVRYDGKTRLYIIKCSALLISRSECSQGRNNTSKLCIQPPQRC